MYDIACTEITNGWLAEFTKKGEEIKTQEQPLIVFDKWKRLQKWLSSESFVTGPLSWPQHHLQWLSAFKTYTATSDKLHEQGRAWWVLWGLPIGCILGELAFMTEISFKISSEGCIFLLQHLCGLRNSPRSSPLLVISYRISLLPFSNDALDCFTSSTYSLSLDFCCLLSEL